MNPARKKIWKAWIPAIIWLGVIVLESTGLASASNSSWIMFPIFHYLTNVDLETFFIWNHHIRKMGHFVGYGLLSYFFFRAWRMTLPVLTRARWDFRWAAISFVLTAFVASLDEWHQSYLPSRTGRWQDVVIDSSAALTIQILLWLVLRGKEMKPTDSLPGADAMPSA